MIFPLCKCFDINWHKFEKKVGRRFSNLPKCNPSQSSPVLSIHAPFGFPVFYLSSSIVLNRYFHILVNSMTIWSVLKLPKIAWPSPFKSCATWLAFQSESRPICTVRLCRIWQAYDRPTTWIASFKSNLQLGYDCPEGLKSCRRPVVSLLYATKSYRVNRPLQNWQPAIQSEN